MNINRTSLPQTLLLCLIISAVCMAPGESSAARQYRCDGRIQYRPCADSSFISNKVTVSLQNTQRNLAKASYKRADKQSQGERYAEVRKSSYKKLAHANGQWRGLVRGNGDIHLTLEILRKGEVESRKYMGHVFLEGKETNFSFISASPKGTDWTWRVMALAR